MFVFKVDPNFIIIFPQRMPQILFYIKFLLNGLRYSKLKEEQQMKLFAPTNRHQPQPQPVPRARISSFLAILMSHYSRWIKRGHCQYVIFFFCIKMHRLLHILHITHPTPCWHWLMGVSLMQAIFVSFSIHTHCWNNRPRLYYRFLGIHFLNRYLVWSTVKVLPCIVVFCIFVYIFRKEG